MTSGSEFADGTTATDALRGGAALDACRCPACGAARRRADARFCHTCGRQLAGDEDYAPADSLRASYHAQQITPASRVVHRGPRLDKATRKCAAARLPFIPRQNRLAAFALASIVYALIPLLGVLFCLPAILLGGWGAFVAPLGRRGFDRAEQDGRRAARFSFYAGLILLSLQLLLWWALRRAPQLAGAW